MIFCLKSWFSPKNLRFFKDFGACGVKIWDYTSFFRPKVWIFVKTSSLRVAHAYPSPPSEGALERRHRRPRSIIGALPQEKGNVFGAGDAENFFKLFRKNWELFLKNYAYFQNLLENLLTKLQQQMIIDLFHGFFEICKLFWELFVYPDIFRPPKH